MLYSNGIIAAGGCPHQDPAVRAGTHLPRGARLFRHQDREGGVLRADSHQVRQEVHLRGYWYAAILFM